jgi:hypothetical protein
LGFGRGTIRRLAGSRQQIAELRRSLAATQRQDSAQQSEAGQREGRRLWHNGDGTPTRGTLQLGSKYGPGNTPLPADLGWERRSIFVSIGLRFCVEKAGSASL